MVEPYVHLIPDPQYDYLFDMPTGKTNPFVKLTESDRKAGVKILCKEPYAQELYNKFVGFYGDSISTSSLSKDLQSGEIYNVRFVNFRKSERLVECEETMSGAAIYIPQNEFDFNLVDEDEFMVVATKIRNGAMYGSLKKCKDIISKKKLAENMANEKPFTVKIVRLVKGGFIATYNDCVECFLPGAHAAANIIYDFESYIGKEVDVMVDNYDKTSELYIVSHKKFIKHQLPIKVRELEFGKKYTGKLTSDPTKYGMFVEFEGIFTGLIHIAEFDNYEVESKKYRSGDEIEFYITRISSKNGRDYKINLTTSLEKIDETTKMWMDYKNNLEGKIFEYEYDKKSQELTMLDGDTTVSSINVEKEKMAPYLGKAKRVYVTQVDVIDRNISFNLIAD